MWQEKKSVKNVFIKNSSGSKVNKTSAKKTTVEGFLMSQCRVRASLK
jgi:hypothetical protein